MYKKISFILIKYFIYFNIIIILPLSILWIIGILIELPLLISKHFILILLSINPNTEILVQLVESIILSEIILPFILMFIILFIVIVLLYIRGIYDMIDDLNNYIFVDYNVIYKNHKETYVDKSINNFLKNYENIFIKNLIILDSFEKDVCDELDSIIINNGYFNIKKYTLNQLQIMLICAKIRMNKLLIRKSYFENIHFFGWVSVFPPLFVMILQIFEISSQIVEKILIFSEPYMNKFIVTTVTCFMNLVTYLISLNVILGLGLFFTLLAFAIVFFNIFRSLFKQNSKLWLIKPIKSIYGFIWFIIFITFIIKIILSIKISHIELISFVISSTIMLICPFYIGIINKYIKKYEIKILDFNEFLISKTNN